MPWTCTSCSTEVADDATQECPACAARKDAWTLQAEHTRQLVITKKKFECLRAAEPGARAAGAAPYAGVSWAKAEAAPALPKETARRLIAEGQVPAPKDVLCVRVHPTASDERAADVTPLFEGEHWLSGRLFANDGPPRAEPFDLHVALVYGGEHEEALDLRADGVHFVEVTDAVAPEGFAPSVEVQAVKRPKKTLPLEASRRALELLELQDALFRTDSAVILPGGDEPEGAGSEGPEGPPTAVGLMAQTLRYLQEHPSKKLLVAGHTDTTGSHAYNLPLSELRARCALATLTGARATFVEIAQQRSLAADYQQILAWVGQHLGWPVDPGPIDGVHGPKTTQAIRDFQQAYDERDHAGNPAGQDLAVDGLLGPATWGGLFDCYELATADELGVDRAGLAALRAGIVFLDASNHSVGCGEHHPIENVGVDHYKSEVNRRVEVLLFDPGEEPTLPQACHSAGGKCDPAACELYDRACYDRRPLPPMVSAKAWSARWEGEARIDSEATMVLEAPGLAAGEPVRFRVLQEGFGEVGAVAAVASEGGCTARFGAWFREDAVGERVHLGLEEEFAPVRFTFVAEGGGRAVTSDPLAYADTFNGQLVRREDGAPLASTAFSLLSPWGTKQARTDASGVARVTNLPPGGIRIRLRKDVVPQP